MNPIQFRVQLFALGLALIVATAVGLIYKSYFSLIEIKDKIAVSHVVQELTKQSLESDYDSELFKELEKMKDHLDQPERKATWTQLTLAYSLKEKNILELRAKEMAINERAYIVFMETQLNYIEKKILYFGGLAFTIVILGLFYLKSFIVDRVFHPLRELRFQMFDFLNGKYSYEFTVPTPDEVGDLQTSFNSMAQKVLNNMAELKALDSAKSEFLNIASHELRTPMTSIKGSLGLINSGIMGNVDPQIKELLDIAETETDRLIRLINDILDMAKIESGRMSMNQKWTDIDTLISKTVSGIKGLADQAGIQIEILEHDSFEAYLDVDRIQQVLTNLLSNAIKFSPKGGTVWVRIHVDYDHHLLIQVVDEGRGISPEDQSQLFQKFKQVTSTENPLVKGTGLGLAIAKAFIESHRGRIGVSSQTGKGSNFFFTLPDFRALDKPKVEHGSAA